MTVHLSTPRKHPHHHGSQRRVPATHYAKVVPPQDNSSEPIRPAPCPFRARKSHEDEKTKKHTAESRPKEAKARNNFQATNDERGLNLLVLRRRAGSPDFVLLGGDPLLALVVRELDLWREFGTQPCRKTGVAKWKRRGSSSLSG